MNKTAIVRKPRFGSKMPNDPTGNKGLPFAREIAKSLVPDAEEEEVERIATALYRPYSKLPSPEEAAQIASSVLVEMRPGCQVLIVEADEIIS